MEAILARLPELPVAQAALGAALAALVDAGGAKALPKVPLNVQMVLFPMRLRRRFLVDLENVLRTIGSEAGLAGEPTITKAKSELGPRGKALASKMGRLSKARNSEAHPETALVNDIRAAFEEVADANIEKP
ncbi:unnamed protein product [Prorocentrum cordatum]|uniref:Uncharacterized protein n=1 Tax=Prorocentrum cordatum TaxID=2364126 RepID=A0ABN9PEC0_9DINO|nr:unnamed protein product [Polarella glacialis]